MKFQEVLPVSYLLFTTRGRIPRLTFWTAQILIWSLFYIAFSGFEFFLGYGATIWLYPFLFAALLCTSIKRLHDLDKSGYQLFWLLLPVIGVIWSLYTLGFRGSSPQRNRHGLKPGSKADYFINDDPQSISHLDTADRIVNDVTRLNPVIVSSVVVPKSVAEVQSIIRNTAGSISVGGGRFSMGGQTASHRSTHLDMRQMNKILDFDAGDKSIVVQSGIRWCDIQAHIDPHDLSLRIMQTYANFTVGGSLSVNSHGRYIGQGPLIQSVQEIEVVLSDGDLVRASRSEHSEIFFAAIGGYNAIGIIVSARLQLSDNVRVKRRSRVMPLSEYKDNFISEVRANPDAVFHNGDIYPPHYSRVNSVSWEKCADPVTVSYRLMPLKDSYPIERSFLWAFTELPLGKQLREFVIDPLLFSRRPVHWKNYEAGYDVAELEPKSRQHSTYVLQEYFVPIAEFENFASEMAKIFQCFRVNVLNVSIRHATQDDGSLLAWAPTEVFAFVIYYKQATSDSEKNRVAVWTRELIDAAIACKGTYYLPYQPHATVQQLEKAYPGIENLRQLKLSLDPDSRFTNVLWDRYLKTQGGGTQVGDSEFKQIFCDVEWADKLYVFLQQIFHLYPEEKLFTLLKNGAAELDSDEAIYQRVQSELHTIVPFLAPLRYGLPALKVQKAEMTTQTLSLHGTNTSVNGYLEIGSTGRYISSLRKHLNLNGETYLTNDRTPDNSLPELFERGQLGKIGSFFDLNNYDPIDSRVIPDESLDLVTCYIGLHHCPVEKLDAYTNSIHRVLRKGGRLILRDHDASSDQMTVFVSLIHTVFNLGLEESWEFNCNEYRAFRSIDYWSSYLEDMGFSDSGQRLLQDRDPSDNTLMLFTRN